MGGIHPNINGLCSHLPRTVDYLQIENNNGADQTERMHWLVWQTPNTGFLVSSPVYGSVPYNYLPT